MNLDSITFIPRVGLSALRTVPLLIMHYTLKLFKNSEYLEPKTITKSITPILLLHGSGSNQRQFDLMRLFLESDKTGHIFSVNFSRENYHDAVKEKIKAIKERYLDAGLNMKEIILVGHSMGGLVAACHTWNDPIEVKTRAIIAISTPWRGVNSLSKMFGQKEEEDCYAKKLDWDNIYCFSAIMDPIVRPSSSRGNAAERNQMHSKWHDHYSTMLDPFLAIKIRKLWIEPLCKEKEE